MLQQESGFTPQRHNYYAVETESLSVIAYSSVAVSPQTDAGLEQLLQSAQARNRAECVTGVLVYDCGRYFQWLEGPFEALARIWDSISHDHRHREITVLRDEPVSDRVFDGWDLRIATGARVSVDAAIAAMECSTDLLKHVIGKPKSIVDLRWEDLFATIVIPRLQQVHGRHTQTAVRPCTAAIWHAETNSGAKLAQHLIATEGSDAVGYVDSLLDQGASFNALYQEVLEPAQWHLGKLWDEDCCDDVQLATALARLEVELHRVNLAVPGAYVCKPGRSVLLSAQPSEPHRVGLLMSSVVFERKGWEVTCQFPPDNRTLDDIVHAQWFDVLKVSQSGSLRRGTRLAALRDTIASARSASLNPGLIVMVDGRTFAERPQIFRSVNANASSASALGAEPLAERLVQASQSVMPTCQVS